MKYSLANYILTLKPDDVNVQSVIGDISVGGEGSAIDNIQLNIDSNLFETTGFATGGWVHDKNMSRVGTASVNLSQLSKNVGKFKQLVNLYYSGDYDGLTLTVIDTNGNKIAECKDCFPQKIPTQEYSSKAGMQTWTFTCGKITIT